MSHRRTAVLGVAMIVVGWLVFGAGAIVAPHDFTTAIVGLLLVPALVSLVGCALTVSVLVRTLRTASASEAATRIIGLGVITGLGFGLAFGALGIVSQFPDQASGANGTFIAGSAPGLAALTLCGVTTGVGALLGIVAALVRRRPAVA